MDSRFEDVEWVPDPSAYEGPETRDLDYDEVQGGEPIGSGGFARVTTATIGGRELVVKEPVADGTVDGETIDDFVDEAETWARLDDHSHVVSVVDWGTRFPWIAMEHMDGGSLADRLESGELGTAQALWTGICLSRALRHAHRHGVAHLDLTPDNVLFRATPEGTWDIPKIGDWGLSEALLDQSGTVEGLTPNYAAPEQFDPAEFGQPDDFTDRFQLATVIYEALTGEQAFPGSGTAAMRRVLDGDVTPPTAADSRLPDELDEIFGQALAIRKTDRYETVVNFRRDLASVLETVVREPDSKTDTTGTSSDTGTAQRTDTAASDAADSHAHDPVDTGQNRPATLYEAVDDVDGAGATHADLLLDDVPVQNDGSRADEPLRLAVDHTFTVTEDAEADVRGTLLIDGEIRVTAHVLSGTVSQGAQIEFQPAGAKLTVGAVKDVSCGEVVDRATPVDTVTLVPATVTNGDAIDRGDLGMRQGGALSSLDSFQARLYVLDQPSVVTAGYTPVVHTHTGQVATSITELSRRLIPTSDGTWEVEQSPEHAEAGDVVHAAFSPKQTFAIDPIDVATETGWFTVHDAGDVVALGVVTDVESATTSESALEPTMDALADRLADCDLDGVDAVERIAALFDDTSVRAVEDAPFRLPVQDVRTLDDVESVLTGEVVTGSLERSDSVRIQPTDTRGKVGPIKQNREEIDRTRPGQRISFHVYGVGPDDARKGDVCRSVDAPQRTAETFRARILVTDHPSVITAGYTPVVHAHTAQVACTIDSIEATIDPDDGSVVEERPDFVEPGDAAEVVFEPQKELSVEPITEIPELGTFTVRDMGQTIAIGGVLDLTERTNE